MRRQEAFFNRAISGYHNKIEIWKHSRKRLFHIFTLYHPFSSLFLRTSATALRALYGIVHRICRTLINQTGADRWHIFICMGFFMCVHFRAAKGRYLCCCRSASFFWCMAASEYDLYLHSIIHISCLVFFGRMKYNKKCCRMCRYGLCDAQRSKWKMEHHRHCKNGNTMVDTQRTKQGRTLKHE